MKGRAFLSILEENKQELKKRNLRRDRFLQKQVSSFADLLRHD